MIDAVPPKGSSGSSHGAGQSRVEPGRCATIALPVHAGCVECVAQRLEAREKAFVATLDALLMRNLDDAQGEPVLHEDEEFFATLRQARKPDDLVLDHGTDPTAMIVAVEPRMVIVETVLVAFKLRREDERLAPDRAAAHRLSRSVPGTNQPG